MTVAITPTQRKSRWYLILDQKFGKNLKKDITFTSDKNVRSILCQNKPKLLPNSLPGVYQLDCSCNGRYIGESKKKVLTRFCFFVLFFFYSLFYVDTNFLFINLQIVL